MSYQTSSKLSRSFWLLIGARKLCVTLNLEGKEVRDEFFLKTSMFPYIFCNFDTVELQKNLWEN